VDRSVAPSTSLHWEHVLTALHIQLISGLTSIFIKDATYTPNSGKPNHIGIQNNTAFQIYAFVYNGKQNILVQDTIYENKTNYFSRSRPEPAIITIGSGSGGPRAYMGRPGYILHIYGENHGANH